jgi:DNA-binding GntR family transcriptional regulator
MTECATSNYRAALGIGPFGPGTLDDVGGGELESYSLVELAFNRLSAEILSGRTDPGERLVEEQLTRQLGISRAPLREALRQLAPSSLVEHIPRRGVRVATLSDDDVRELYEVRDVLERGLRRPQDTRLPARSWPV